MKTTIRRFGVLSLGKIMGATYGLMGLIFGAIFSLFAILGATAGMLSNQNGGGEEAVLGLIFGVGAIIFLPLFYGFMGFISGLLGGAIYNLVAGFTGGIEMELEGGPASAPAQAPVGGAYGSG